MRFRCSNCGYDHDIETQSYMVNPESGTIVVGPWFKEKGLNHQATGCLMCGTIHATAGSALKAALTFFSRMVSVKFYITIEKLRSAINEQSPNSFEEGLEEHNFPPALVRAFFERGYFKRDEKFLIGNANEISIFFAQEYIRFCKAFEEPINSMDSLEKFSDYALGRPNSDEAIAMESALAAVSADMLSWEKIFDRVAWENAASRVANANSKPNDSEIAK